MSMDSFTTPDKVLSGTRYGVYVAGIGEDFPGEDGRWVAFTHDRRRAIAAVSAEVRAESGDRLEKIAATKVTWWRIRANCGCGEKCAHPDGSCWEDEDGLCEPTLPPCGDSYGWIGEDAEDGAELAFPVIVFDVVTR